jgi:hypothetical protein
VTLAQASARIALVVGALGSLGFMLQAGRSTPRLLLVAFIFWVLSPFVGLAWADKRSQGWSALTRLTLYWATLVITLGSLAYYGQLLSPPPDRRARRSSLPCPRLRGCS